MVVTIRARCDRQESTVAVSIGFGLSKTALIITQGAVIAFQSQHTADLFRDDVCGDINSSSHRVAMLIVKPFEKEISSIAVGDLSFA
jgi:hypothetical protein